MRTIYSLFFFFISAQTMAQSPWVPKVNEGFVQLGFSGLYYDQVRYNNEVVDDGRQTRDNTYQVYFDYGIAPKFGITAIVPFKHYSITEAGATQTYSGLSNLSVGAKYQLIDKDTKAALGLKMDFNTGRSNTDLGLRTGFEAATFLPYFSIGSGTKKTYFYANAGYGIRTNGYSDFVQVSGEFGYKFIENAYIVGTMDFTTPTSTTSSFYVNDLPIFRKSASFLDRQCFRGLGLKVLYDFVPQKYGLTLSTIGALKANNMPFSRSYNVGIYAKL